MSSERDCTATVAANDMPALGQAETRPKRNRPVQRLVASAALDLLSFVLGKDAQSSAMQ